MKKILDERLRNARNEVLARKYWLFISCILLGIVVKFVVGERSVECFLVEIAALAGSFGYVLFYHKKARLPYAGKRDEYLQIEHDKCYARAFMVCFAAYVYGNLYYLLYWNMTVIWINVLVWYIPDIWVVAIMIKRGLIIPVREKSTDDRFMKLKKKSVLGGFLFGVFMGIFPLISSQSQFDRPWPIYVLTYALAGLMFGVLWYFGMKFMMKWSERRADKEVEDKKDEGE